MKIKPPFFLSDPSPPTPSAKQPWFCSDLWFYKYKNLQSMQSQWVRSPLRMSPETCLTLCVIQRHAQNRKRYSLNAPSQGGVHSRKKQKCRSKNRGQIHSGSANLQLDTPAEVSSCTLLHKPHPFERKIRFPQLLYELECLVLKSFVWKEWIQMFSRSSQVESPYYHKAQ